MKLSVISAGNMLLPLKDISPNSTDQDFESNGGEQA
jgi:hypothetical protein